MTKTQRVIVVGGGISGLATALAIERSAAAQAEPLPEVVVLEAAPAPGGKVRTTRRDGFVLEWGPTGFLNREPATLALCRELGLAPELLRAAEAAEHRYVYLDGKLVPVPMNPAKLLTARLLPIPGLARMLAEPFVPRRTANSRDESIADFARRRVGKAAYENLVDAMVTGIWAGDAERLSLPSTFPLIAELEQRYGSVFQGLIKHMRHERSQRAPELDGKLTAFHGGLEVLIERMAQKLGPRLRCGVEVSGIARSEAGFTVVGPGLDLPLSADAVVLACPSYSAGKLITPLDKVLGDLLRSIEHVSLAVVCLAYRRRDVTHPLNGFGFLVPQNQSSPILGALFSSSIFPCHAPSDQVLLRVLLGGARDPSAVTLDDNALVQRSQSHLAPLLGLPAAPTLSTVFRHHPAIPQYTLGHAERLRQIGSRFALLPGLVVSGNAYRGIATNDCLRNAGSVAHEVLDTLKHQRDLQG